MVATPDGGSDETTTGASAGAGGRDVTGANSRSDFRYRAFLSYSHADRKWGRWLMRKLETYRVPKRLVGRETARGVVPAKLAPVFRDRDELSSASDLSDRIQQVLEDSAALIVIASPASARSRWVNEEILAYKRLGRFEHVHCFIVDGDPESEDDNCFAPAVRYRIGADGRLTDIPVEPIAADARAIGDGRQRALTRLIAGLLGVDYDDLYQRELVRRQRRMFAITAASVVGMAVTATLAGLAVMARQDAERRRGQAESLVGFMLGDMYERLYEIGRTDIYAAVGDKATEYFKSLESDDLTDTALAQRSEALRKIGETRADQEELDRALEAFEFALELSESVTTRQPQRTDWQLGLAETHYWIGYVDWKRGELDAAAAAFRRQLQVIEALVTRGDQTPELLRDLGYAYTNLGRIEEGRGELDTALEHYERVRAVNEQAARMAPDDLDTRLESGFAHNNLGLLLMRMGRLEEAERHFREDLEIKTEVADAQPGHGLFRGYQATSQYFLGRILEVTGEVAEAMDQYAAAAGEMRRQFSETPDNHARAKNYANYERRAGDLARRRGDMTEAALRLGRAAGTLRSLGGDHAEDAEWLSDLAAADIAVAFLSLDTGNLPHAELKGLEAYGVVGQLMSLSPGDVAVQRAYMSALLLQGELARLRGDEATATREWEVLVRQMHDRVRDSYDPDWLAPYVVALHRLGRTKEAAPYVQRLREMAYRRPGPALALLE